MRDSSIFGASFVVRTFHFRWQDHAEELAQLSIRSIFNLDPLVANGHLSQSIQRGLTNWKLVWNRRLLNGDERHFAVPVTEQQHQQNRPDVSGMWRRPGFWRHAPEFWLLAQLYVDRQSLSRDDEDIVGYCYDDVCMTRLKALIAKFSGLDSANRLSSMKRM
jgi:hypothetical protein